MAWLLPVQNDEGEDEAEIREAEAEEGWQRDLHNSDEPAWLATAALDARAPDVDVHATVDVTVATSSAVATQTSSDDARRTSTHDRIRATAVESLQSLRRTTSVAATAGDALRKLDVWHVVAVALAVLLVGLSIDSHSRLRMAISLCSNVTYEASDMPLSSSSCGHAVAELIRVRDTSLAKTSLLEAKLKAMDATLASERRSAESRNAQLNEYLSNAEVASSDALSRSDAALTETREELRSVQEQLRSSREGAGRACEACDQSRSSRSEKEELRRELERALADLELARRQRDADEKARRSEREVWRRRLDEHEKLHGEAAGTATSTASRDAEIWRGVEHERAQWSRRTHELEEKIAAQQRKLEAQREEMRRIRNTAHTLAEKDHSHLQLQEEKIAAQQSTIGAQREEMRKMRNTARTLAEKVHEQERRQERQQERHCGSHGHNWAHDLDLQHWLGQWGKPCPFTRGGRSSWF